MIANGPLAGRAISSLRGGRPLPLLTKIIDAREALSVQVHPDLEAAIEFDSEEKSEAWYILEAEPEALVYKGFRDGVRVPDVVKALRHGFLEELLHSYHPEPGDVIFLPAGTVHAIGGGLVLFEVSQNSDTTYRLFDWNRKGLDGKPREIHREQAIRSTDFSGRGLDRVAPRTVIDDGLHHIVERVACRHFVMEEHEFTGLSTFEAARGGTDRWHAVFLLAGRGVVRPFGRGVEEAPFSPGDSLLLPAEHECYEFEPQSGTTVRLLATWVP